MARQIYVNLPVKDIGRTRASYTALGFSFNLRFSNEQALSCNSRAEVDDMVARVLAAGGSAPMPVQDLGFMYSHDFEDPDGHVWEPMYMDPNAVPPQA